MERHAAESPRQDEAKAAERRRQAVAEAEESRQQADAGAAKWLRQDEERRQQAEERQCQLEVVKLKWQNALASAEDKVKLFKKQAEIQAKLRKQQSMASQYSKKSSQKYKFSKTSRSMEAKVE